MSLQSSDVGKAAPGYRITHNGTVYEFRHLGTVDLAAYERDQYDRARALLREMREDYPPDEYVSRLDVLRERFERHEFDLIAEVQKHGTPRAVPAILALLRLLTGRTDEENWSLLLALPEEVGRLCNQVMAESFPKAQARPEGQTAGPN